MKDDTPELVKFATLKRLLTLDKWQVVGVLEALWLFARKNCPCGDVGRFSNVEIAAALEWNGDANQLVASLTSSKWLDHALPEYRLVCHDWYENAPNFIVRRLNNSLLGSDTRTATSAGTAAWRVKMFGREKPPDAPDGGAVDTEKRPAGAQNGQEIARLAHAREPNLTQPNQTHPHQSDPWEAVEADLLKLGVSEAAEAVRAVRDAGCSIVQVRNLMEFWRGRLPAWGPGALYERLLRYRPDQSFDSLWPPVSPTVAKQAASAAQTKKQRLAADERRKAAEQHESDNREAERLEKEFGKTLDALDRSAVKKMIGDMYPESPKLMIGRLPESGPPVGLLRVELLHEIERRWQEEST